MSITSSKKVALVTGANKGIGKAVAKRLAEDGYRVYLGHRDASLGAEAVSEFKHLDVLPLIIDVSSDESVKAAADHLSSLEKSLDVLVNNAATQMELTPTGAIGAEFVSTEAVKKTYEVNVFGVIRTTHAFLPLLKASQNARIVNVSSSLGSLSIMSDESAPIYHYNLLAYCSSKTALNAVTVCLAKDLKKYNIKVNAADPGHCATDMGGANASRTADQGAAIIVKLAQLPDDGPTGSFESDEGVLQW